MSAAGSRSAALTPPLHGGDLEARFRTLVQSPLRAGLLRFLNARPDETFDVEALMSTSGRMRLDVENCLSELVDFGVVRRIVSGSQVLLRRAPAGAGGARAGCSTRSSNDGRRSARKISRRRSSASAK